MTASTIVIRVKRVTRSCAERTLTAHATKCTRQSAATTTLNQDQQNHEQADRQHEKTKSSDQKRHLTNPFHSKD